MELLLDRDIFTENSTTGKLSVDGVFECFTLEDKDRSLTIDMPLQEIEEKKVYGKTAIPKGRYPVIITHSEHFGRDLPLLVNVPGYEGVRIHPGNVPADTLGCVLVGQARSVDQVINSRSAFAPLAEKIANALHNNNKVYLTIQ